MSRRLDAPRVPAPTAADVLAESDRRVAVRVEAAARRRAERDRWQSEHLRRRAHGLAARHARKLARLNERTTTP